MRQENLNYFNDRRVQSLDKWYDSWDGKSTAIYQGEQVEVALIRCNICNGKGTHVNPSIDSGGLTAEDFREDPDFLEEYCSGMYDVSCYCCGGRGLMPIPLDKSIFESLQEDEEFRAMQNAERRYGA